MAPKILNGKVAIVTGGAAGIGSAIAKGFIKEGAIVCVADINEKPICQLLKEIEEIGGVVKFIKTDVAQQTGVKQMVAEVIASFGKIDILVNNAGIAKYAPFLDYPYADWKKTLEINLTGYFLCAQEVAKKMIGRKNGKIINIASIAAKTGLPNTVAYTTSKSGIVGFTRVIALELASYGITVNAIGPGPIMTEMAQSVLTENDKKAREAMIPMGRYGETKDLIGAALYLASSASDYVTGQVIYVDGGYTISGVARCI